MQNICFAIKPRYAPHQSFSIDLKTLLESHRSKKLPVAPNSSATDCKPAQVMSRFGRAWIKFDAQRKE